MLTGIHLHTHSSASNHSRRQQYRSAIYIFDEKQRASCETALQYWQAAFNKPLITAVYAFGSFRASPIHEQNYYYSDSSKPFCKTHIDPKLKELLARFATAVNPLKLVNTV